MATQQIQATAIKKLDDGSEQKIPMSINYDFGENLEELVEKCGNDKEVVRSNAISNIVITIQSGIRRMALKGYDQSYIQEFYNSYIPGKAASRTVDVNAAFAAAFSQKSVEEQEAELEKLRALLEARRAAA